MAFALSADHARQEQVWEAIQQRSWLQTPHHIRRLLTENTISSRSTASNEATAMSAASGPPSVRLRSPSPFS
jgi:hypothetical protein